MILALIVFILVLDQLSKYLITQSVSLNHSIPLLRGVFHITHVHNRGAAFGILQGKALLFILTSLCAIVLIYFHLRKSRNRKLSVLNISLALLLAGAVGNLIDRVRFGYVIDFLDFRVWPVFNVADSAVTIGTILLALYLLKPARQKMS